mgnify:FL=1
MIQRRAPLPKFKPGDHVRMIDNSPATVVSKATEKSHYYFVDSPYYGRCTIFAGELEKDDKRIISIEPEEE